MIPSSPTTTSANSNVRLQPNASGLLTVWLDSTDRSVNVFDAAMLEGLESAVEHIASHADQYSAVVFRSRKPGCFFAGADVHALASMESEAEIRRVVQRGQDLMSAVESLPMPTIAAIDGSCLGGGLEFALACQYRVASTGQKTKLGLPEIKLGLIPGWGGTQRLPRVVGLRQALPMILTGKSLTAERAAELGLVDRVVEAADFENDLETACQSLLAKAFMPGARRIVRRRGIGAWLLEGNWFGRRFVLHMANRQIRSQVGHYPALAEALVAIGAGCGNGGKAFDVERDSFVQLMGTDAARSLLGLFVGRDRAKKVATWTVTGEKSPPSEIRSVAVIGAGVMGAGIGTLAAAKGYQVVFKEIDEEAVRRGRWQVSRILQKQVDHRKMHAQEMDGVVTRMQFTLNWEDISDCDLAVEAVSEVEPIKREVFEMLDRHLREDALLTSNTSSLCVSRMPPPERRAHTAGLHFFNPVERMELVEVVRTEATDENHLAPLLEFVRALGKTPIVTSDKPGFLVNRVLFPYLGEAVRMVSEGYDIPQIDQQMKRFGMPMGPLKLIDQVGVDIAAHVAQSLSAIQPEADVPSRLLSHMADRGWLGMKAERGFYCYENASGNETNPRIPRDALTPPLGLEFRRDGMTSTQRRMVYAILNEAVHCLDEFVVAEPWMVDLGMVLGTGFAPMYGGPLRLIDLLGPPVVLHNMQTLAVAYGRRFDPADGLVRAVRRKETFLPARSTPLTWERNYEPRVTTQT